MFPAHLLMDLSLCLLVSRHGWELLVGVVALCSYVPGRGKGPPWPPGTGMLSSPLRSILADACQVDS